MDGMIKTISNDFNVLATTGWRNSKGSEIIYLLLNQSELRKEIDFTPAADINIWLIPARHYNDICVKTVAIVERISAAYRNYGGPFSKACDDVFDMFSRSGAPYWLDCDKDYFITLLHTCPEEKYSKSKLIEDMRGLDSAIRRFRQELLHRGFLNVNMELDD